MHAVYARMKEGEEMERDIVLRHEKPINRKQSMKSRMVRKAVRKKAVMVYSPPKLRTSKSVSCK